MKSFLVYLAVCLYGVAPSALAQVYRCVVGDAVTISTAPCPAGAKETEFKPEPDAAEREASAKEQEAAAKRAADEKLAQMKERIEVMARERQKREAAFEAARREEELRGSQSASLSEPAREEGIVEQTVILPVAPPPDINRYPNQPPGNRPDTGRPPPLSSEPPGGNRPGKDAREEPGAAPRLPQNPGAEQNRSSGRVRLTSKPKATAGTGKKQ
ncbi:MAG: hypothetical protein LBQ75_04735 [Zoogloeaceae bacterium]|nr:hypothetical protein [Zoogloeaceae bacterium]